jgi:hypothetical protein
MADAHGTFGTFGPSYHITDGSVVLAKQWWPLILAPGIPAGLYVAWLAFDSHVSRIDGKLYIVGGMLLLMLGVLGVVTSPLKPPGRITVTPGELHVGGQVWPRGEVASIEPFHLIQQSRYGTQHFWSLQITMLDMKVIKLRLMRGGMEAPYEVLQLIDSMRAVLGGEAPPKQNVIRATRGADGNFVVDPRDAAAFQAMLSKVPAMPQWAPDGAKPRVLTESITEASWRDHVATGKERQRARYGLYFVRVVEPTTAKPGMQYSYRLFVHPAEGQPPVLAINAETSPFGTSAIGVHEGGKHTNIGAFDESPSYDDFIQRARTVLDEVLLA